MDMLLQSAGDSFPSRVAITLLLRVRRLLIAMGDPPIVYRLGSAELRMPLSHELPFHKKAFPEYSASLGRIGAAVHAKYPAMTCVDIGANIGDSLAILRESAVYPVLCIDGSDRYFPYLMQNVTGRYEKVVLEQTFLGAASESVHAEVQAAHGTERLSIGGPGATLQISTLSEVLERHTDFSSPKLIKLDTDGMDIAILLASMQLISATRAVLFFEYDPYLSSLMNVDAFEIFDALRRIGYRRMLVYENTGDLLLTAGFDQPGLLMELHGFYSGRHGTRYADICAFHGEDEDVWEAMRQRELSHFSMARRA